MKICPKCYARNYDNAEICFNCRTSLVNIPIVTNCNLQMNHQMQSNQQISINDHIMGQISPLNMVQQKKTSNEPNKKKGQNNNSIVLILSILSCLLLITNAITLFFLINEKNKTAYINSQYLQLADIFEPSENNHPIDYQTLQFGQKLDIQEIDIQLDTTEWEEIIRPKNITGGYEIAQDISNEVYYYLLGSIKNKKGDKIDLSRSVLAYFTFNDKYSYPAKFYCVREGVKGSYINIGPSLSPLESGQLMIVASVPNEIRDKFEHCVLTIGYNDDFGYIDYSPIVNILTDYSPAFEELDHVYQLQIK